MNLRQIVSRCILLIVFLFVSVGVRHIVVGGLFPLRLAPAQALAGSVATSLVSPGASGLPVAGKDFRLVSSNYFDSQDWAVVSVVKISDGNGATLVLHKLNGIYVVVLGPGTRFSPSSGESLPPDVVDFLTNKGVL